MFTLWYFAHSLKTLNAELLDDHIQQNVGTIECRYATIMLVYSRNVV